MNRIKQNITVNIVRADVLRIVSSKYMTQDTGKFRTNLNDQFYTNDTIAKKCIQHIIELYPIGSLSEYLWIEPSAGNGSFLHQIPSTFNKIGIDIEPKSDDIQKHDYLTWSIPLNSSVERQIIVFGNPPFGRQSSFAKAFITKSCSFAKIIAFILPKSFMKPSMNNVFHRNFHLVFNIELEKNAFMLNGVKYDVPCVFQIWEKKDSERQVDEKVTPIGFQYIKLDADTDTDALSLSYDIALRRVGGLAGKCYRASSGSSGAICIRRSIQSHYFIRFDESIPSYIDAIIGKINNHTFPSNTVGPRSLSKSEINIVLNKIIQEASAASAASS